MSIDLRVIVVAAEVATEEGRAAATDTVSSARDLARLAGATLRIVSVIPRPVLVGGMVHAHGTSGQGDLSEAQKHDAHQRTATICVEALARHVDVPAEGVVVHGDDVPEGLINAATACGADLIVIASHGRTGLKRLVLGSVAEAVARRAPVPVLLVHPEPAK